MVRSEAVRIHRRYGAAKGLKCEVTEGAELHRILDGSDEVSD